MSFKFCCANVQTSGWIPVATGSVSMIRSVVLPDGTSYAFEYNDLKWHCNYGSLTKITLPTGGTISYTYVDHDTTTDFDTNAPNTVSETTITSRFVTTRTVTDHTGAHTWNYLTGADPNGDVTTHQFSTPDSTTGVGYETGTLYYKASSTLLKNVQTTYSTPVSTKFQGAVNYFPVARTTTLDNGSGNERCLYLRFWFYLPRCVSRKLLYRRLLPDHQHHGL